MLKNIIDSICDEFVIFVKGSCDKWPSSSFFLREIKKSAFNTTQFLEISLFCSEIDYNIHLDLLNRVFSQATNMTHQLDNNNL